MDVSTQTYVMKPVPVSVWLGAFVMDVSTQTDVVDEAVAQTVAVTVIPSTEPETEIPRARKSCPGCEHGLCDQGPRCLLR
jgi:hypothetical protein